MSQTFVYKHNYKEGGTFKIYCIFVFGQAYFLKVFWTTHVSSYIFSTPPSWQTKSVNPVKMSLPKHKNMVILLLHKGLTHIHSQIKHRLRFGESSTSIHPSSTVKVSTTLDKLKPLTFSIDTAAGKQLVSTSSASSTSATSSLRQDSLCPVVA